MSAKQPFDIEKAVKLLRVAVAGFPKAALFELAEMGHKTPFEQLVACIISIRTRDEVMLPVARKLFERASTPQQIAALSVAELDRMISRSSFHEAKARQIHDIAVTLERDYNNALPCDRELMLSFKGVGPKCTNLVMGIVCDEPYIGVDVHVHRVTNRWGYVRAKTPEKTMLELETVLPKKYWVEINELLVPFGKHICTGTRPKCTTCPLLEMCRQIGVDEHR